MEGEIMSKNQNTHGIQYPDDNRRYVLVVNRSGITPIRHVVTLETGVPYYTDEFQAWYYDNYRKLEGDEFIYCLSTKSMQEEKAKIEKEWDEQITVEEKKQRWEWFRTAQNNHERKQ